MWVVVQGNNGHYYLQKPPVQFVDSHQWTASNVITAVGASMIKFVYVTPQGQNSFQGMVDAGFYEFYSLPEGSKVLKDIPLQVIEG